MQTDKQTKPISSREHSTLAGLRQRLQDTMEACELCVAYLDDQKKWRVVASHINDMQSDLETAEQQINELL